MRCTDVHLIFYLFQIAHGFSKDRKIIFWLIIPSLYW